MKGTIIIITDTLVSLFSWAFHKAAETCSLDTDVRFTCLNDVSDHLPHHFLPDQKPAQCVRMYYSGTEQADDRIRCFLRQDAALL